VRDNENDGGDSFIRVNHSFFGADDGYPYLYAEHPDEALPSVAVLGRDRHDPQGEDSLRDDGHGSPRSGRRT
jgi:hypothetical protein